MPRWIDDLLGYNQILSEDGTPARRRHNLRLVGATVDDDGESTVITMSGATTNAEFFVGVSDAGLPSARVPVESSTIGWNLFTPNTFVAFVKPGSVAGATRWFEEGIEVAQQDSVDVIDTASVSLAVVNNVGAERVELRGTRAALSGAITAALGSNVTDFGAAAALSVLANADDATGVPGYLEATAAYEHLRVNAAGTALEWHTLELAELPAIPSDTVLANVTGSPAPAIAVSLTSLAGNGMAWDGTTNRFDVGGSTSIIAGTDDIQRAALTGFAAAAQNSNVTTSAEPLVSFSASSNMSNERVLTSGTNTVVDISVASQIRINVDDFPISGLGDIGSHSFLGNVTGSSGAVTANSLSTLAGTGLTYNNAGAINWDGIAVGENNVSLGNFTAVDFDDTTSVIVTLANLGSGVFNVSLERAALTGFVAASQNSNATTSAEPIVTFSASSNMSNERVLSNGTNTVIDIGTVGQIQIDVDNFPLSGLADQTADTFNGNFTAGLAPPTARAGTSVAGAGLTYTTGGTLAVGAGTHITVNADDVTINLATLVAAIDSVSVVANGSVLERAALTGAITAAQNSNATLFDTNASGAGLTGGGTAVLAVGAGTHITVNANDVAVNLATLIPAIDSPSVVADGTVLERAALTGAIAAAQDSNATLFSGIRDNGASENDRTNLNYVSGTRTTASVTDDAGNDELEVKVDWNGVGIYEPDGFTFVKNALDLAPFSSTSIIADALDLGGTGAAFIYARAALTGAIAAAQNSNATLFSGVLNNAAATTDRTSLNLIGFSVADNAGADRIDISSDKPITILAEAGAGPFHNYAIPNLSTQDYVMVLGSSATFTGFAASGGNVEGYKFRILMNVAGPAEVDFFSASSLTANKVVTPDNVDMPMVERDFIEFQYISGAWRVLHKEVTVGGSSGITVKASGFGINFTGITSVDFVNGDGIVPTVTESPTGEANVNFDVDVSDFAGTGLEDDGSENLRIAASAAGNGLTGGGGSALAVGAGDGIDVAANDVAVDVSDFAGDGLEDDGSNNLRVTHAPLNYTRISMIEEFLMGEVSSSIGSGGVILRADTNWFFFGAGSGNGSSAVEPAIDQHPGIMSITTAAVSGNGCILQKPSGITGGTAEWEFESIFRVTTGTTVAWRVGLSSDFTNTTGQLVYFERDTNSSNVIRCYYDAGTGRTLAGSGVVDPSNNWVRLRCTKVGTTLTWFSAGAQIATFTGAGIPSGKMNFGAHLFTRTSSARSMFLDRMAISAGPYGARV